MILSYLGKATFLWDCFAESILLGHAEHWLSSSDPK